MIVLCRTPNRIMELKTEMTTNKATIDTFFPIGVHDNNQ